MSAIRGERGAVLVETPFAICIVLLLAMGLTTLVQVAWTHLALSSAVEATTRYAAHVEYDPTTGGIDRRRTDEQVMAWAEEVAAEVHDDSVKVSVVGHHPPSTDDIPVDQLVAGDEVVVIVTKTVSNPLYRVAASIANAASHVVGEDDVFDPDGIGIKAEAVTFVE
jgi:hypothetical protein